MGLSWQQGPLSPGAIGQFLVPEPLPPYKGLCSYYSVGDARQAAWSYPDAYSEVRRISNLVSFEPDIVSVHLDGVQLHLEPGQTVVAHGPDRNLDIAELGRAPGGGAKAAASR